MNGRIVVLGVGNVILGDDGLGVRCVERLIAAGALPDGVVVIDGGTSSHELLGELEGAELLVIVDAVAGAGAPGDIVRVEGDRIAAAFSQHLSPHQRGIRDLLATLELVGRAPARIVVLGMAPARIDLGLELSPAVAAALPALAARVVAEVT